MVNCKVCLTELGYFMRDGKFMAPKYKCTPLSEGRKQIWWNRPYCSECLKGILRGEKFDSMITPSENFP